MLPAGGSPPTNARQVAGGGTTASSWLARQLHAALIKHGHQRRQRAPSGLTGIPVVCDLSGFAQVPHDRGALWQAE